MPRLVAKRIEPSDNQKCILEQFANGTHTQGYLKQRAQIVVLASKGLANDDIETTTMSTG